MAAQWLAKWAGTEWTGTGELWLDPEGNQVDRCDCALRIETDALHYSGRTKVRPKRGSFTFEEGGATWVDSWHQSKPTKCVDVPGAWGLFTVEHTYEVPSSPAWGWRSKLSERPNGDLVLQMANLAPWGEEGRAVRMTFARVG